MADEVCVETERGGPGREEVHREILHQRDEEEITRADPSPEEEPKSGEPDDRPEEREDRVETHGPERKGGKSLPQLVPAYLTEKKEQNRGCYEEGQNDSRQVFLRGAASPFSICAPRTIVKRTDETGAREPSSRFGIFVRRNRELHDPSFQRVEVPPE